MELFYLTKTYDLCESHTDLDDNPCASIFFAYDQSVSKNPHSILLLVFFKKDFCLQTAGSFKRHLR